MNHDLRLVWRFLIVSTIIIAVSISAVFINFYLRTKALTEDALLQQARALADEVVLTRRWVSENGGVYVKLKPEENPNPYKSEILSHDPIIQDSRGNNYLLRIPGAVVRSVSKLSESSGLYTFHVTTENPSNLQTHAPDAFEKHGLAQLAGGKKEYMGIDRMANGSFYRYMTPLLYEDSCRDCHGMQGLNNNDKRAALTINIPMAPLNEQLQKNLAYVVSSALAVFVMLFGLLYLASRQFLHSLTAVQRKLVEMATTDALTGRINRGAGLSRMEEKILRHRRLGVPLSCIMVDLDFFKQINDHYGHAAGDAVLVAVAEVLENSTCKHDMVFRYGGEEFLLLLSNATLEAATVFAEKLRLKLDGFSVIFGQECISPKASFGVTQMSEVHDETSDEIIRRADFALYNAKSEGRNRVRTAPPDMEHILKEPVF